LEWTGVRIPTRLFGEITDTIKNNPGQGYTNEHEFIRDAVREKIEKVNCKDEEAE